MADDIKKISDEINKLRAELGKNPLKPFDEKDLEQAKALLSGIRAEVREISSDLDYVAKSFKDSVNELSNQKSYLSDAKKSLNGIANIAQKITEYRRGETSLNEKQLKDLQKQAKFKFEELEKIKQVGNLSRENQREIIKALDEQELFNKSVERTVEIQKQVNKGIGLLGTGIGGVAKALSKMGFGDLSRPLDDAIEKTKNARMQIKLNADEIGNINELQRIQNKNYDDLTDEEVERFSRLVDIYGIDKNANEEKIKDFQDQNLELSTQTSKYKNIGIALKEQLTKTNLIDFAIGQTIKSIVAVDKQTGTLAKSFNITYLQANELRKSLTKMAIDSGDVAVNTRGLQESLIAVGSALGSNAELNKKDLITFTQMREKAGLTNDELTEMQKLTYVSGGNLEDNLGSLMASAKMTGLNNKMLLNEKDIMRDVVKTSNAIKLSLGGSGEALGAAAAQVKVLGMNMQQVESIAGSLLDFESSISAELEAELLTGKNLNLERARLYAINNDMAGVAREIRKNYGDTAEFAKLNRIQQEAAAKAVGMTREDLARTLTDEKALQGLNGEKRNAAQVALDFARAQGMTEAQIGAKSIEDLNNQMGIQERLNASVEKLKESFVVIAEVLVPIFSGFADLVGFLAKSKLLMGGILGVAIALKAIQTVIAVKAIITAMAKIFEGSFMAGPFGLPIALAGAAALGGIIGGVATMVGDMGYDNKTGKTTISTRKGGLFAISDDDQIRVEPNALNKNTINKPKSSQDARLGEIMNRQQNQIADIINLQRSQSQKPIYVSAKVNDRELLYITANTANERANVEKTTAYKIS